MDSRNAVLFVDCNCYTIILYDPLTMICLASKQALQEEDERSKKMEEILKRDERKRPYPFHLLKAANSHERSLLVATCLFSLCLFHGLCNTSCHRTTKLDGNGIISLRYRK